MLWDLYLLIKDIPADQIGSAFDIRHATIEAGLSWPVLYDVMKPHIGAVSVKDFDWDGRKTKHVPLGTGRVDPKFFKTLKQDHFHNRFPCMWNTSARKGRKRTLMRFVVI